MSSFFSMAYIQIMKFAYMVKNMLPVGVVEFGRWLRGWDEQRESPLSILLARITVYVPASIRDFWYRRDWWKAVLLKKIFPETWLYERDYQKRYKKWEQRIMRRLIVANNHLGRSLTIEEVEKLKDYESKFTNIRLLVMDSNPSIAGLCVGYSFFAEDACSDDEHVCRVLYRDGEFDSSYITPNMYLSDKFYENFDSITKENFAFWHEYLMRNRDKLTVETINWHIKQSYAEMRHFFDTGAGIFHNAKIVFSEEEEEKGGKELNQLGIVKPYICIFSRDARYNVEMKHAASFEKDSLDLRNSDINAFKLMTQYFSRIKIQSVRMGACMATEYHCDGAIDYATCGRTEFLDAYIFSNCRFFIGDGSGIFALTYLAGRPWAVINIPVVLWFEDLCANVAVGIFLKYYDPQRKRYLCLREIAELQLKYHTSLRKANDGGFYSYVHQNYEIVHNTPEEILDVAKEMDAIYNHNVAYTAHDEELQQQYRLIIKSYLSLYPTVIAPYPGRIGMQWLRENEWFLE